MKRMLLPVIISLLSFLPGCTINSQETEKEKMNCYSEKLKFIKETPLYKEVMSQFKDTFKIMSRDKQYFGVPEVVSNEIGDAVFFNEGETECLLIVLQRNTMGLVFGVARVVRGKLYNSKWEFQPSIEYTFSKDYYNKHSVNSFENISPLARYSVLTDGVVKKKEGVRSMKIIGLTS